MNNQNPITDQVKQWMIIGSVVFGPLLIASTVFALKDNKVAMAVCLTIAIMLALGCVFGAAYAAGAQHTRTTMHLGAHLVLTGQESDDRRDAQQMAILGKLMLEGGRIAQRMRPADTPPALPMPSQMGDWQPNVTTLPMIEDEYPIEDDF